MTDSQRQKLRDLAEKVMGPNTTSVDALACYLYDALRTIAEEQTMRIPETIYLQWYGEDGPPVRIEDDDTETPLPEEDIPDSTEVCWCGERIYDSDIEYRRVQECVWTLRRGSYDTSCEVRIPQEIQRVIGNAVLSRLLRVCPSCGGTIKVVEV